MLPALDYPNSFKPYDVSFAPNLEPEMAFLIFKFYCEARHNIEKAPERHLDNKTVHL